MPPSYKTIRELAPLTDPFDTSAIYTPENNFISPSRKPVEYNNCLEAGSVSNGIGADKLDSNFIAELERCSVSESIPIPALDPPPQQQKSPRNYYANNCVAEGKQNNIVKDTTTVINEIWHDLTMRNVSDVKSNNALGIESLQKANANHEFGAFKCNYNYNSSASSKNYDKFYESSAVPNTNTNTFYSNKNFNSDLYANNTQAQNTQYNAVQPYSDVAESLYSEIPEHFYSPVADDLLRPHRPAPPSPLVLLGQPQSMQQIQRKIQQGQVHFFICF